MRPSGCWAGGGGEAVAKRARQVGHGLEVVFEARVDPRGQLAKAVVRLARREHELAQIGEGEVSEMVFGHGLDRHGC